MSGCSCCKPETDLFDDFDGSLLSGCYWLRSFTTTSGFVDRWRHPGTSDETTSSKYTPKPFKYTPTSPTLREQMFRLTKVFPGEDYEQIIEAELADLDITTTATQFQVRLVTNLVQANLSMVEESSVKKYQVSFTGFGQSFITGTTAFTPADGITLSLAIHFHASPAQWSATVKINGSAVTFTDPAFVPSQKYNFSGYPSLSQITSLKNLHYSSWIIAQGTCSLDSVSLQSAKI